jgi:HK97 family phage major capsid protein
VEQEQESSYLSRLITTRNDLAKEREVVVSKRDAIVKVAKTENREVLNDDEDREFRGHVTDIKRIDAEMKAKDELIQDLDEENQRRADLRTGAAIAQRATSKLESVTEQAVYTKGSQRSFFKDLADIAMGRDLAGEAQDRLRRHQQDVRTLPEYQEYRLGLNTTSGAGDGGTFTPPAYLLAEWIKYARPGRPFADIIPNEALPHGTMQVNVPKISTGTAVGWQATQNSALGETDLTDSYVTANVCTIGGNQTVARQLLDQAGIPIDTVVFGDLTAAHAQFLDAALYAGSGSSGQIQGLNTLSGIQTVATGGLTIQYTYAAIANAIQSVYTSRFAPPDAILMHPRRWGWFLSLLDTTDRPLFLPDANSPMNVAGVLDRVAPEAVVGRIQGIPVIADPNISTTGGTGSNQDAIYVVRSSDLVLYESGLRAEAFREPLAAQLSVLLQVSSYCAFLSRYPNSVVQITGFTPPTWGS